MIQSQLLFLGIYQTIEVYMSQRQFHINVYFNKQLMINILYIEVIELA